MSSRRRQRHVHQKRSTKLPGLARSLDELGQPPERACPKCKSEVVRYYDPVLDLWRTLSHRRRLKCHSCGFVWRRSRNTSSPGWMRLFRG
jgi:predicted Zn-ribbon and HTH transcriptional regulator